MISLRSGNRLFPFYINKKELDKCDGCLDILKQPLSSRIPPFQLTNVGATSLLPTKVIAVNTCTGAETQITMANGSVNTGTDQQINYSTLDSNTSLPVGEYYIRASDGNGSFIYSERFKVCDYSPCYAIKWKMNCDNATLGVNDFENIMYLEDIYFDRPLFRELIDAIENGFGETKSNYSQKATIHTFQIVGNDAIFNQLSYLSIYDEVKLCDLASDNEYLIRNINVSAGETGCQYPITINFEYVDAESVVSGCCGSAYENAPFDDDCDENGGGPVDCSGNTVSINSSGLPVLTANGSTGATYQWYKNGAFLTTGSSISVNGFGTYRVDALFDGCPKVTDTFTYLDPCADFAVTIESSGLIISGSSAGGTATTAYEIFDSSSNSVGTGLPFTAVMAGDYTIVATNGDCERQIPITVTDNPSIDCTHEVEIINDGTTLTANVINLPMGATPTYVWSREDANGSSIDVGFTNAYVPDPNTTYIYDVKVTVDGCEKTDRILWIATAEKLQVEICNFEDMPQVKISNVVIYPCCDKECGCTFSVRCEDCEATIINVSGCDGFTFEWKDPNGVVLGTGLGPFDLLIDGTYTITYSSADCSGVFEYYHDVPDAGQSVANPIVV